MRTPSGIQQGRGIKSHGWIVALVDTRRAQERETEFVLSAYGQCAVHEHQRVVVVAAARDRDRIRTDGAAIGRSGDGRGKNIECGDCVAVDESRVTQRERERTRVVEGP